MAAFLLTTTQLIQKGYPFGPSAVESYINTDYKWWEPSCFCEPDAVTQD